MPCKTLLTKMLYYDSEKALKYLDYAWMLRLEDLQPLELITHGCTSLFLPCGPIYFTRRMTALFLDTWAERRLYNVSSVISTGLIRCTRQCKST
jgi:hypothetical protein